MRAYNSHLINLLNQIVRFRKKKFLLIAASFITLQLLSLETINNRFITYEVPPGRLGDCLITYLKSKYFSIKYNTPLLCKHFKYSNELMISHSENFPKTIDLSSFKHVVKVKNKKDIEINKNPSTLFVVDVYSQISKKNSTSKNWKSYYADELYAKSLKYPKFKTSISQTLRPVNIKVLEIPEQCVSIAVHVRKGSGTDGQLYSQQVYATRSKTFQDMYYPLKFPPEQFYIEQILLLTKIFEGKKLFVGIFTDAKDPISLTKRIEKICNNPKITFFCQTSSPVEDLYTMSQFDCLIRSCSHFAGISQLLGNHSIVIRPHDYKWINDILYITESCEIIYDSVRNSAHNIFFKNTTEFNSKISKND